MRKSWPSILSLPSRSAICNDAAASDCRQSVTASAAKSWKMAFCDCQQVARDGGAHVDVGV